LLTGLLFGIAPAFRSFRVDIAQAMQLSSRSVRSGAGGMGRVLISAQIALSLVLVIAAVLFAESAGKLRSTNLGFQRDGVLSVTRFSASGPESQVWADRTAYLRELVTRI